MYIAIVQIFIVKLFCFSSIMVTNMVYLKKICAIYLADAKSTKGPSRSLWGANLWCGMSSKNEKYIFGC